MFAKASLASTVVAAFFSSVTATPLERSVEEPPQIEFSPFPRIQPGYKFAGPRDLDLTTEDSFYWTHKDAGLLANLTVKAAPSFRILDSNSFSDLVQSVDCSNKKSININFKDSQSVGEAKQAWGWVNEDSSNTMIYVIDGTDCGGQHGRQPYHVQSVTYDEKSKAAKLNVAAAASWDDFVGDATMRIHGSEIARNEKRKSVHKKVKISLEHTFNKHFYDADIGPAHLSVDCADCGSHGSLEVDITISTSDGFKASAVTADNVSVRFAVSVTASATLLSSHVTESITIEKFPLAEFKIADIVKITPEITLAAQLSVTDIKGAVTTVFGAALAIPNGQPISIGSGSTGITPAFQRIGPTISGKVSATAQANPLLTLDLSGKILGKHVTGGLGLAAPTLTLTMGADVNTPNAACDGSTTAIHYAVNIGAELASFYGFGKPGDEPHKKPIWSTSKPLLDDCIVITP